MAHDTALCGTQNIDAYLYTPFGGRCSTYCALNTALRSARLVTYLLDIFVVALRVCLVFGPLATELCNSLLSTCWRFVFETLATDRE